MDAIVQADARSLPFADETFDVIVADPPYEGKNRGKRRVRAHDVGYVPFSGRKWWDEAWRVLNPSGHLYVFAAIRELPAWLVGARAPTDIIAWFAPNNPSLMAYWRRGIGGRAPAWRPVIHWQKDPRKLIKWDEINGPLADKRRGTGRWVDPNIFTTPAIQSQMHEAELWPNQLPVALLKWLLRPHSGASVLDLFSGTGTTRTAAIGLGLDVVSVELSSQALEIIKRRGAQMPVLILGPGRLEPSTRR